MYCSGKKERQFRSGGAELQSPGLVSDESAVSIGKMLGSDYILIGSARNNVQSYYVELKLVDVASSSVSRLDSYDIRYDKNLKSVQEKTGKGQGDKNFHVGFRLGRITRMSNLSDNLLKLNYRADWENIIVTDFPLGAFANYRISDKFSLQVEADVFPHNRRRAEKNGTSVMFDYASFDFPLLVRYEFIERPVDAGIFVGGYASVPISKMIGTENQNRNIRKYAAINEKVLPGIVVGGDLSFKLGPSHVVVDGRYILDLMDSSVTADFGSGWVLMEPCLVWALSSLLAISIGSTDMKRILSFSFFLLSSALFFSL